MVRRFLSLSAVAALAMLVSVASAGAGGKSPFEPGLYVGKTSQGEPVKLKLSVGGEPCSGKPCLYAPDEVDQINVAEKCVDPEGQTNEYLFLPGDLVTKSGVVHANEEGFSKTIATLKVGHHGTLTGRVLVTGTLEGGSRCTSGNVTLKAKIGGHTN